MDNTATQKMKMRALNLLRRIIIEHDFLSPQTAAAFVAHSPRSIYRWLGAGKIAFISREDCENIVSLVEKVMEIRKSWIEIVTSWSDPGIHAAVILDLYDHNRRKVLDNPDLSIDEKVKKLTRATLRRWVEKG